MRVNHRKIKLWSSVVASMFASMLFSCSQPTEKQKTETNSDETGDNKTASENEKVSADSPADSTGVMSTVSLGFGRIAPSVNGLALQDAAMLDLGGGVILSDARISIGSIKIKANKEMDESEKALKKSLEGEKETREKALEGEKNAIEKEKEDLKAKYEPQFEGKDDAEKDALKEQMNTELAAIEVKFAALEAKKESELSALEEQRDGNLKWRGPFIYNLVDNSVTPEIPEAQLVDGSYRRIEFKIKPNRTLDGSDHLLNNAIYLAGTVMVNDVATPFSASFRVDEEFKLMGAGALKVDPSASNALTVAFNPTAWFSTVDFSAATVDATGTIVISQDSNAGIWQLIRKNVKRSTKFGEDEDGDGELKDDEADGDGDEAEDTEEAEDSDESDDQEDEDETDEVKIEDEVKTEA